MPSKQIPAQELYFRQPTFEMSILGRKTAWLIENVWTSVLIAGTAVLILSGPRNLFWLGILLALYLFDRVFRYVAPAEKLSEAPKSGPVNTARYLTPKCLRCVTEAYNASVIFGGDMVLRLAKRLSQEKEIKEAFLRLDIPHGEFVDKLDELLGRSVKAGEKESNEKMISEITSLASRAFSISMASGDDGINPHDLFAAIGLLGKESAAKLFNLFDINPDDLEKAMIFGRFRARSLWHTMPSSLGGFASGPYRLRHRFMNRAWTAKPTRTLDALSVDFTDIARGGKTGFLIGHEEEYERLLDTLARPNKPNALLIGEPGAGKEAILGHLAYMIVQDKVPAPLFDKRLVVLDFNSLISGVDQGGLHERIKTVFDEIYDAGNIIVCIPDIHNLSRNTGKDGLSIANVILPLITSNDFPTIGMTFPKEFKELIEPNSSFADAFQFINVQEITPAEAERVLAYDSLILERQYKVKITYGAVKMAVMIAHKHFRQKLLPSSADDLLKEALAEASHKGDGVLDGDYIISVAERRTNVPIREVGINEREKLLHLEDLIHAKLIDQEAAVTAVSGTLREYRSGLAGGDGPIGSFLFVGPTGVGKTELSKILAEIQFGSADAMVRFDMSEYQDKTSFYRFIGSPDGSVSGALTEAILQKPYSLILLDEFEKAYPDVLNLFLQVFDDGRLTDNLGRTIDFKNTIIIATSNAESEFIQESLDKGVAMDAIAEELKRRLMHSFRPELLNRMQTIVFKSLSADDVLKIAALMLKDLEAALDKQGVNLKVEEGAIRRIAELGFSPAYGARPLRGIIADKLKSPLSTMILKKEIERGMSAVVFLEN
ncbi:MAG: ATP-dependent Clp protease ATP-binding subunit, partial [Candidatus Colwellbacteria bacterium]|nr:ATP-dependent Clp protease ATP-binding subunit [Candidatus Colwellbacteria bacterium]